MIKYTWSAPLVQFGRFEVTWEEGDTPPDSDQLGRDYADWLAGVMKAYGDRVEEIRTGAVRTVKDTLGATEVSESSETGSQRPDGFTVRAGEEPTPEPAQDEDTPSWERKVEKSEPWKTGGPVKKPAKINW